MDEAELAAMYADLADAAGLTLAVASHICDAIDPRLPAVRRYAAASHAAQACPVLAAVMASTFAAGMLVARYESDPDGLDRAMRMIRAHVATMPSGDPS